jgi:hypothetical protein
MAEETIEAAAAAAAMETAELFIMVVVLATPPVPDPAPAEASPENASHDMWPSPRGALEHSFGRVSPVAL